MKPIRKMLLVTLLFGLLAASGCASIGPRTVGNDSFDYTSVLAVPYHSYWFWLDNGDIGSKQLFTFMMFLFSLTETGGKEGAPIVTISAGG